MRNIKPLSTHILQLLSNAFFQKLNQLSSGRTEAKSVTKNLTLQNLVRIISKNSPDGPKEEIEQRQTELEGEILKSEDSI